VAIQVRSEVEKRLALTISDWLLYSTLDSTSKDVLTCHQSPTLQADHATLLKFQFETRHRLLCCCLISSMQLWTVASEGASCLFNTELSLIAFRITSRSRAQVALCPTEAPLKMVSRPGQIFRAAVGLGLGPGWDGDMPGYMRRYRVVLFRDGQSRVWDGQDRTWKGWVKEGKMAYHCNSLRGVG
jgi:hypothetical protein